MQERIEVAKAAEPAELTRKATEALTKDVGRGLPRLDPADMSVLGIAPGDVVRLTGKKETFAKAMLAFPEDHGKGIVQVDGLTRDNAGYRSASGLPPAPEYHPAKKVPASPVHRVRYARKEREDHYVGRLLEGLALVEGDRVRATLMGTRSQDFIVQQTRLGTVVIQPMTTIEISAAAAAPRCSRRG